MSDTNLSEALSRASVCTELDAAERDVLAKKAGVTTLEPGAVLAASGESTRTLFVLLSGKVEVVKTGGKGKEEVVHSMEPGECAGTRDFIDGTPREVTLRAAGASEVLTLEHAAFESLLEAHPRLVYRIMRGIFRVTHGNLMRKNRESQLMEDYFLRTGNRH